MEANSLGVGDSVDQAVKQLAAVALTTLVGVLALTLQDGGELRTGFEEPGELEQGDGRDPMRLRSSFTRRPRGVVR